ncbi:hypothetical protein D8B26_007313 [Coccidioides posadasii str. Silveira]|uniref:Putative gamma-glutamylcyclotransferase n=2 Tax=Coccidioides posadasii TaxID=199306 RepID=E9D3F0_COCPS|nr:conserved hypothetical protein [Coccidioides posadasii str. Silveira]QVM12695.1 hypothetical protein D8B26_007313 [Coccidioides posadasii str. Silveira]
MPSSAEPGRTPEPWSSPTLLFVYGSLMDTDVIQVVLSLTAPPPPLQAAKLRDYRMKMWHIYPTLIPHKGSEIQGRVYPVESLDHFQRLESYETRAYTWTVCDVELDDGSVAQGCRVFIWAGDPESSELYEGSFDLERYQTRYKPSMMGRS